MVVDDKSGQKFATLGGLKKEIAYIYEIGQTNLPLDFRLSRVLKYFTSVKIDINHM